MFQKMFVDTVDIKVLILLIIGCVNFVFPFYHGILHFSQHWFKEKREAEQNLKVDYDEMRLRFSNEYDRCNPITKSEAVNDYFKFMVCKLSFNSKRNLESTLLL